MKNEINLDSFCVYEPEKKVVGRKEHIIFAYQTYFNHITIIGKRGKRTQFFIPFGKNVPPSLRGKRYKSPFNITGQEIPLALAGGMN